MIYACKVACYNYGPIHLAHIVTL